MDAVVCPKRGYVNPEGTANCRQCRINLAWALGEVPRWEEERRVAEQQAQAIEQQAREERQRMLDELQMLYHERPNMPLWEYTSVAILPSEVEVVKRSLFARNITIGWESVDTLFRTLGLMGWELVSVIAKIGSTEIKEGNPLELLVGAGQTVGGVARTDYFVAMFKRPLPHSAVESVLAELQPKL